MEIHELTKEESRPVTTVPELSISLSDSELLELIKRKTDEYKAWLTAHKIDQRAKMNVEYWKGVQETKRKRGMPDTLYKNNILHRDLATRVQNATSRMPDVVVMSPQQDEDPSVKEDTKKIEEWLKIRIDSDVTRRLAQSAVRDNHLKFRGIWKYRYDKARKDAVIERLRPEDVVLDSTARIPEDGYTADNMEFIGEWMEEYTSVVFNMFPDKKEELMADLSKEAAAGGKPASSKIRFLQVTARVSGNDGSPKLILVNSYKDILLSKSPHPFWDEREGSDIEFGLVPEEKLDPALAAAVLPSLGLDVPRHKPKRFNHFPWPRMPYSIFSGENLGDGPIDDTTVFEQSLSLQDIVNLRGDQISQTNEWAVPKLVMATTAMTEAKASKISRDPSEIPMVELKEGQSIDGVVKEIQGSPASAALYQDLQQSIQAIDAHFSTSAAVRGEAVEPESGVSKQISREGDLSASDDIAQTMVQRCVEEAANWLVQLAKIYFDDDNRASAPGPDRSLISASINNKLIPDNIQIVVKANAVDKMTQRNMAMNLVNSKGIDPMSLYEDLEFPNPKERTQRLMDFLAAEAQGPTKYLQDIGVNAAEPANKQNEATTTAPAAPAPAAPAAAGPPQAPQPPTAPAPAGPPPPAALAPPPQQ
jgi:hypothetical protein